MIFINQLREKVGVMFGSPETTSGGRALKFYASVRLDVRKLEQIKIGTDVVGTRTRVKVVKNKVAPPFRQAEFDITYGRGISKMGSILDVALERNIVGKSGSWYTYGDTRIGQGRENAKAYLEEHTDIAGRDRRENPRSARATGRRPTGRPPPSVAAARSRRRGGSRRRRARRAEVRASRRSRCSRRAASPRRNSGRSCSRAATTHRRRRATPSSVQSATATSTTRSSRALRRGRSKAVGDARLGRGTRAARHRSRGCGLRRCHRPSATNGSGSSTRSRRSAGRARARIAFRVAREARALGFPAARDLPRAPRRAAVRRDCAAGRRHGVVHLPQRRVEDRRRPRVATASHAIGLRGAACSRCVSIARPRGARTRVDRARREAYRLRDAHLQAMYPCGAAQHEPSGRIATDGTAYVKTGDIPAEWLRDASAQVRPYLFFAKSDPARRALLRGIIAREGQVLQIDPYANAFTLDYRVWEQKFELDSLAYPIMLAWTYWKATGDASIFTPRRIARGFDGRSRRWSASKITRTIRATRTKNCPTTRHGAESGRLYRNDLDRLPPLRRRVQVQLSHPVGDDGGRCARRTRRDRARRLSQSCSSRIARKRCATKCRPAFRLTASCSRRITATFTPTKSTGSVMPNLMDDANIPSLLSAPYLGYTEPTSPVYRNTRRFLLSKDNPYFYSGTVARGIGSAHTNDGWVWPLALHHARLHRDDGRPSGRTCSRSCSPAIRAIICLHESFDPNDPQQLFAQDFGWPNALFSEYVMTPFNGVPPAAGGRHERLEFRGE